MFGASLRSPLQRLRCNWRSSRSSRIDSVDELELGGENSTGDVGSEEEGAARGGVNLQSRLDQAFASRISDIDGGKGDDGRDVEREVRIGRSGNRRSSRAIGSLAFIGGVICVGGGVKKLCNLRGGRRAGLPTLTEARARACGKSSEPFACEGRDVRDWGDAT